MWMFGAIRTGVGTTRCTPNEKRALSEWANVENRKLYHGWLHLSPVDWPQTHTMARNMEFLHASGVVGFRCGMGGYSPSLKLSMYAISRNCGILMRTFHR